MTCPSVGVTEFMAMSVRRCHWVPFTFHSGAKQGGFEARHYPHHQTSPSTSPSTSPVDFTLDLTVARKKLFCINRWARMLLGPIKLDHLGPLRPPIAWPISISEASSVVIQQKGHLDGCHLYNVAISSDSSNLQIRSSPTRDFETCICRMSASALQTLSICTQSIPLRGCSGTVASALVKLWKFSLQPPRGLRGLCRSLRVVDPKSTKLSDDEWGKPQGIFGGTPKLKDTRTCILVALMILRYSAGGCTIKNDDLPIIRYGGEIHVVFFVFVAPNYLSLSWWRV